MSGFEVIGAIAAAGQFIGQGLKLVRLIETVYSQIRDAPDEIKERLERLESFASIAKRIRNNESLQTSEAEKILLRCEHHVQKLQSCLEAIAFKADDPLKQRAWIALCSLGEEDEILKIFEKLEREQSLLVLHFSDLNSKSNDITLEVVGKGLSSVETRLKSMQLAAESGSEEEICLRELFQTDPSNDRRTLQAAKGNVLPGTCDWILERPEFIQWRNSDEHLLWISGGPGMGKTMLSVYLTEHLERHITGHALIYFFCDHRQNTRNNAMSILRGLLFQLIQQYPRLISHLLPDYRIQKDRLFDSFEGLWNIFMQMINSFSHVKIFCVLDGLDECEPVSLEALLQKFSPKATINSSLKAIIVSREHPNSLRSSLYEASRVRLDPDAKTEITEGLEHYIAARVEELARSQQYPDALSEHVKQTLKEQSKGIYLWASFVIEDLKSVEVSEVEKCLLNLPRGLDAIYERMLQQVPFDQQQSVRDILSCCVYSFRHLTLHELGTALDIQDTELLDSEQVLRGKLSYCGHLLNITDRVMLVHQSAHDFLTRENSGPNISPARPWYSLSDAEQENAWLAAGCLSCLMREPRFKSSDTGSFRLPTNPKSPSLPYAKEYWIYHLQSSKKKGAKVVDQFPAFFAEGSTLLDDCLRDMHGLGFGLRVIGGLPHLASRFNLEGLMQRLFEQQRKTKWRRFGSERVERRLNGMKETPLHTASLFCNLPMVRMLLENGAPLNAKDPMMNETPLIRAIYGGSQEVVEYLVKAGADLGGPRSRRENTPLAAACSRNEVGMVKLLLEQSGCAPKIARRIWWEQTKINVEKNPTPAAKAILTLLLEHCKESELPKQVECSGYIFHPFGVLHAACAHSNLPAIQALIRRCPKLDLNRRCPKGWAPLHYVAMMGDLEIMQFLCESHSINPGLRGKNTYTPLDCAIESGNLAMVKFLVNQYPMLQSPTTYSSLTPVHVATLAWKEEKALAVLWYLVQELKMDSNRQTKQLDLLAPEGEYHLSHHKKYSRIEHSLGRASLWHEDKPPSTCYETPLSLAIRSGHSRVVSFLIDECNVDPNDPCRGCDGARPLHVAVQALRQDMVRLLIRRWDVNVNGLDDYQRTPLHSFAKRAVTACHSGEDFRVPDDRGAADVFQSIASQLVEAGADVKLKDGNGDTVHDLLTALRGHRRSDLDFKDWQLTTEQALQIIGMFSC